MITFTGKGAFGGYAMGQILFYNRIQTGIKAHTVDDPISELERFFAAQKTAIEQLGELYEKALLEVGRSSAMIFQIHQMMLEDVDYVGSYYQHDTKSRAKCGICRQCDSSQICQYVCNYGRPLYA